MKSRRYAQRALALLLFVFLSAALPNLGAGDKKSNRDKAKQSQATKYVRPTDPSLYVGSETSKTCHQEMGVRPRSDIWQVFFFCGIVLSVSIRTD